MSAHAAPLHAPYAADPSLARPGSQPGYTLRDLLTAVFYHRRAVLIAFGVPVLLGLLAALASHPIYVADARLLVLLGNDYVFQPTGGTFGAGIALDRDQIVQGELEILKSTTLAIETLQEVGPLTVYRSADLSRTGAMELLGEQLEKDLTITAVPESNVVELSFRSYDPDVAADVLKTLINHYLKRRAEVFSRSPNSNASDQRDIFANRLSDAEQALTRFDQAHGISDFDAQVALLLSRKSVNTGDAAANEQQVAQTEGQLAALQSRIGAIPPTVELYADSSRAPSQQGLGDALAKLEANRSTLVARYRDDFPLVRDADQQIAELKGQIARTPGAQSDGGRRGINPLYQDISGQVTTFTAQLSGLQARRAELAAAGAAIQARLDEMTNIGAEYRDLKRSRDALDTTYTGFVRETEQTSLNNALERSRAANIRIIQSPQPPGHGISLRPLIAIVGVVLGIISAVATLVVLVALRQVFVTFRDVETALDLPVLVAVPLRTRP